MTNDKRPLKVFLCHAHADRDAVRGLYARLTTPPLRFGAGEDGVEAWLDKEKLLPPVPATQVQAGQDWEVKICKAVYAELEYPLFLSNLPYNV